MSDKKMTWLEHEEEAERLLALAKAAHESDLPSILMSPLATSLAAQATAHATLALVRMPS